MTKIKFEEVTFANQHGQIYGQLYQADNNQKKPLIVISHGLGSSYEFGIRYAKPFAEQGFAAYTFNFNGGQRTGDMTKMTLFTEVDDLMTVIDSIKNRDDIDTDKVFLLGCSQGGVVSSLVASSRDDIKALILQYPAFVMKDDLLKKFPDGTAIPETYPHVGVELGREYATSLYDFDLFVEASQYTGPVLDFHGTADCLVPYRYSEKLVPMFENATLIPVQNEDHVFSKQADEAVIEEMITFLKDFL